MPDVKKWMTQEKRVESLFKNIQIKIEKTGRLVDRKGEAQENEWPFQASNPMIQIDRKDSTVHLTTANLEGERAVLDYLAAVQQTLMKTLGKDLYLDPMSGEVHLTFYWNPVFILQLEQAEEKLYEQTVTSFNQLLLQAAPFIEQKLEAVMITDDAQRGIRVTGLRLDHTTPLGIAEDTLRFFRLLFLASFYAADQQEMSVEVLLERLSEMVKTLHSEEQEREAVSQWQKTQRLIEKNEATPLESMQKQHATWWENPFLLQGYGGMELSTQLMLSEAIQRGITFEVIDGNDQVIKLVKGTQVEYVKNTNMTSKDTYIAPLIMENKTATKEILRKQGFHVPYGKEFSSVEEARQAYDEFADLSIVVKPKSTNFGLGISIFQEDFLEEDFTEALRIAFAEDTHILVEEFMPGTEYRFYVLDGRVEGVILRVAANVEGDGVHTIEELVALKNQDPLRGTGYRRPLQKLALGDIEKLMLKTQGYQVGDVLEKDQVVYLRENSNVSTGGDSIDMTDDMHPSYNQIAAEAVQGLGAFVSGIDLMIPDYQKPATRLSSDYGIIEANFNPAIHMHMYPYQGKGRPLAGLMLDKLFG